MLKPNNSCSLSFSNSLHHVVLKPPNLNRSNAKLRLQHSTIEKQVFTRQIQRLNQHRRHASMLAPRSSLISSVATPPREPTGTIRSLQASQDPAATPNLERLVNRGGKGGRGFWEKGAVLTGGDRRACHRWPRAAGTCWWSSSPPLPPRRRRPRGGRTRRRGPGGDASAGKPAPSPSVGQGSRGRTGVPGSGRRGRGSRAVCECD